MKHLAAALLAPLLAAGCELPNPGDSGPDPFDAATDKVVVEVDFQEGAEPFTGDTVYGDTWDLTVENLTALLGGDIELEVPRTLEDMGALEDVPEGDVDATEIVALGAANSDASEEPTTATYHVLFVDRFVEEDGERRSNVLGVSIGSSRVVAMFKPVIGDGGGLLLGEGLDRFVEQATMVHELGHALGLVNNGLAMQRDHEDEANGAHCSNDECVMFFLNEGFSDATQFARDAILRNDRVLFDDDCLDDAASARE